MWVLPIFGVASLVGCGAVLVALPACALARPGANRQQSSRLCGHCDKRPRRLDRLGL